MSQKATILYEAKFNEKIISYLLTTGCIILFATIFGIFFIPFWLLIASIYLKKYYERLECDLTTRSLRFKKGYLFHTERTIPLDKIQDLTFKEGPLLKYFGLSILKIETAGSSGQTGADLSLIGIVDANNFRSLVLEQRDKVTENSGGNSTGNEEPTTEILKDIRDALQRIENKLPQGS